MGKQNYSFLSLLLRLLHIPGLRTTQDAFGLPTVCFGHSFAVLDALKNFFISNSVCHFDYEMILDRLKDVVYFINNL